MVLKLYLANGINLFSLHYLFSGCESCIFKSQRLFLSIVAVLNDRDFNAVCTVKTHCFVLLVVKIILIYLYMNQSFKLDWIHIFHLSKLLGTSINEHINLTVTFLGYRSHYFPTTVTKIWYLLETWGRWHRNPHCQSFPTMCNTWAKN